MITFSYAFLDTPLTLENSDKTKHCNIAIGVAKRGGGEREKRREREGGEGRKIRIARCRRRSVLGGARGSDAWGGSVPTPSGAWAWVSPQHASGGALGALAQPTCGAWVYFGAPHTHQIA